MTNEELIEEATDRAAALGDEKYAGSLAYLIDLLCERLEDVTENFEWSLAFEDADDGAIAADTEAQMRRKQVNIGGVLIKRTVGPWEVEQ